MIDEDFIYDGDQPVLDFTSTNGSPLALDHRYLFVPGMNQILAQENVAQSFTSVDRIFWMLGDDQGSVRDVLDNSGTEVTNGHYVYDAYGDILSGDPTLTRFTYVSAYYDLKTALQLHGERWYQAFTGRWTTEDPAGQAGGPNESIYCGDNPTNQVDTNGMWGEPNGYWANVGATAKGYFWDGPVGMLSGVGSMILHPIDTATGLGSAALHPIATAQAVGTYYSGLAQTSEGQGRMAFDVVSIVAPAGLAKLDKLRKASMAADAIGAAEEAVNVSSNVAKWDKAHPLIEGVIDTPRTAGHMALQEVLAEAAQESGFYQRVSRGSLNLSDFSGLKHVPDIKPDMMALTLDGRIDMWEVLSPGQSYQDVLNKIETAMQQLPPEMRGGTRVIDPANFLP